MSLEMFEHWCERFQRSLRHGLDDELNVPDPFSRICAQLVGDDLRTSSKR